MEKYIIYYEDESKPQLAKVSGDVGDKYEILTINNKNYPIQHIEKKSFNILVEPTELSETQIELIKMYLDIQYQWFSKLRDELYQTTNTILKQYVEAIIKKE